MEEHLTSNTTSNSNLSMDIINILQQITQYLMNDDLYEDERDKIPMNIC